MRQEKDVLRRRRYIAFGDKYEGDNGITISNNQWKLRFKYGGVSIIWYYRSKEDAISDRLKLIQSIVKFGTIENVDPSDFAISKPKNERRAYNAAFGSRIREMRLSAGLTPEDLAHACNLKSVSSVHYWECGSLSVDISRLRSLCKALHCSLEELIPQDEKQEE